MPAPLTLTALDTAYEAPDAAAIARVLRLLDGGRVSLATLARSDGEYLQVRGSPREGFTLEYQEGSVEERFRSRETMSLERATQVFQSYAQGELRWRDGFTWEVERIEVPKAGFTGTWFGFGLLVLIISALFWLWRGW